MNRPIPVTVLAIVDFLVTGFLLVALVPWWLDTLSTSYIRRDLVNWLILLMGSGSCALVFYLGLNFWRMSPRAHRVGMLASKIVGVLFLLGTLVCVIWFVSALFMSKSNDWTWMIAMVLTLYQALITGFCGLHLMVLTRPNVKEAFGGGVQHKPAT